jgi:TolB-like protein
MNICFFSVSRLLAPRVPVRFFLLLSVLLFLVSPVLHAQNINVAVLGLENLNRDPRYDYLEGMITGVLLYDLTRVDGISLVERARLDRIIDEQNLRLTGWLNDEDTARQVGQLAGADILIDGDYAFLGRDLIINMSLLNTSEGTTLPVSARGNTENTIHELAEQIVESITGKPVILAGVDGERSLLSLSDEEPGSIEFYCGFINGEIFVDGEFFGYTPGGRNPILLEDLSPGEHVIRVEAGNDFGEIIWPEIRFVDWERTVDVKTGRKTVLRGEIQDFSRQLTEARRIFREEFRLEPGVTDSFSIDEDADYTDRRGRNIPVKIRMEASVDAGRPVVHIEIDVDGEIFSRDIDREKDELKLEEEIGPVKFEFDRSLHYKRFWEMNITLRRRDIRNGMQRDRAPGD